MQLQFSKADGAACGVCSERKKALLVLLIGSEHHFIMVAENRGYGVYVTGNINLNEMQEIHAVVFGPKAIFMRWYLIYAEKNYSSLRVITSRLWLMVQLNEVLLNLSR